MLNLTSTIRKITRERDRLLTHARTLSMVLENLAATSGKSIKSSQKSRKGRAAIAAGQKRRWAAWRKAKKAKAS